MTEALELQGRWWLPDHGDHRVFGTLSWNASGGGTLHLQDELRPVVWLDNVLSDGSVQKYRDDRGETQAYPLILGRVENRVYTLLDSFRLSVCEQFRTDGSVGDHLLAEQLFWLFVICLLRLTDARDAAYERISKHSQIGWLTDRADASRSEST
jgi:hypothetical protein